MHTVWTGAISFGLVHVPVKMYTATEDKDIHFRSLHKECGMPISYAKTCRHCEKEMKTDEIVKGYEYEKDRYVVVKEDELENIKGETAKTVKILDFVDLQEIDPLYFQKAYYPSPDMAGAGAYSLLLEAIRQTGKIGIAKMSNRSKSSLAAIRVVDNCICLETMLFPDEIRALSYVPNLPPVPVVNEKELNMAKALVEQLSENFEPKKYTDDYRVALFELIENKIASESVDIVSAPSVDGRSNVIDLMAALQLRSKFPYFFVDEFQDTNSIQVEILKILGEKEIVIGIIGDKAQSIYGFQGAEPSHRQTASSARIRHRHRGRGTRG